MPGGGAPAGSGKEPQLVLLSMRLAWVSSTGGPHNLPAGTGFFSLPLSLWPHVVGPTPFFGSGDVTKATPMEHEAFGASPFASASWDLSAVLPAPLPADEELQVVLKPRGSSSPVVLPEAPTSGGSEGAPRATTGGAPGLSVATLDAASSPLRFLIKGGSGTPYVRFTAGTPPKAGDEQAGEGEGDAGREGGVPTVVELRLVVQRTEVSPFSLAACWKAQHGLLFGSTPRHMAADLCFESSFSEEGEPQQMSDVVAAELQQYEVPVPGKGSGTSLAYAADSAEDPTFLVASKLSADSTSLAGSGGSSVQGSPPAGYAAGGQAVASALDAALEAADNAASTAVNESLLQPGAWGGGRGSAGSESSGGSVGGIGGVGPSPVQVQGRMGSSGSAGGEGRRGAGDVRSPTMKNALSIKDLLVLSDGDEDAPTPDAVEPPASAARRAGGAGGLEGDEDRAPGAAFEKMAAASAPVPMMEELSVRDGVLFGARKASPLFPAHPAQRAIGTPGGPPAGPGAEAGGAPADAATERGYGADHPQQPQQQQQQQQAVESEPGVDLPSQPVGPHDSLPAAEGAVAAAAVSERLSGSKERRRLAIVMVGLPARGKTFTAAKLTRYLRWLGHDTKHFNVGKYRRLKLGAKHTSEFFSADNKEGVDARNEVAQESFLDMLSWMDQGGQVGVFDATNSTRERRNMLLQLAENRCKVIFLECLCNDESIIDRNAREKIRASPDYASRADPKEALHDFILRLRNYEKVYEPVMEGSYIKLINMVSGSSGQMQVNNISGYLPGRIVFFLLNTHITPRPVLLTRHGESQYNVSGRIGGDPPLSPRGEEYSTKLAEFLQKRLRHERMASVWTSTLQRTILTARNIAPFPKVQWRALDEINAGVCDGMTYLEIKESMPDEYKSRKMDKLRYRYPRGESYLDVIQRLEPVIVELERQRHPVVVIAHQAVLRSLYAYFMDKPLKEVPHIEMPLHTVIELTTGVSGINERRYKLMDSPQSP